MQEAPLSVAIGLVALLSPALGQSITTLVLEDDVVAGVGAVTRIDHVTVSNGGAWMVEADTDHATTDADSVLIRGGVLLLRENQSLPEPTGALLDGFDGIDGNASGTTAFNFFLDNTGSSSNDSGVFRGTELLIQEGQISGATAFTPGTPYIGFFDVKLSANDRILVVASIDDAAINSSVDRALVLVESDAAGNLLSETVLFKEGDVPPGQTEAIADFGTSVHESALDADGNVMWSADLAGDTAQDMVVYVGSTLVAQEGSPAPVAGRTWGSLTSPELDLGDGGDWAFKERLDSSSTADDEVIVRNGTVLAREGDVLAAIAPFALETFGTTTPVYVSSAGDVLWYGDWDDPDGSRDEGLFLNTTLIVQEGVTQIAGQTLVDLAATQDGFRMSDDGRWIIFEGEVDDGQTERAGAFLVDLALGTSYCGPAVPNSTGAPGLMAVSGSPAVADNNVALTATDLPSGQFGYFLAGRTQGFFNPPGSSGILCLSGNIGRYNQVVNIGQGPAFSIQIDVDAIPVNPPTAAMAGETWNFQCWYRDLGSSNFTDAVAVPFQ
ncbi:MAG: hypothetical protein GY711_08990 [bacterium]|nr:hypothetical protein [bacterium]